MSPEMSNSQPMGSTWSNPAHPAATFCPAPSWWWLCPRNNLSPALGTHPSLRSNHTVVCDQCCLSWNRGTGHSAVLTHEMANTFCILIHWLNTVLWTVKNMQLCVLLLIKEFKNGFQDWQKKKSQFFCMFAVPFLVYTNALFTNIPMECIELQSDIQLKSL